MTTEVAEAGSGPKRGFQDRLLDGIEKAGNKVPHPVIMFLYLILGVAVLSAILAAFDVSVTESVAVPVPIDEIRDVRDALGGSVVPYDVITGQQVEIPEYIVQDQTFDLRNSCRSRRGT